MKPSRPVLAMSFYKNQQSQSADNSIFKSPSPYYQMIRKAELQRQNQYIYIKKQLLENKMGKIDEIVTNFLPEFINNENDSILSNQQIYSNRKQYLKQVNQNLQELKILADQLNLESAQVSQTNHF